MLEKICPPALLYLAFSMIQITIDLFQGEYETSLLKFIIMLIFAAVLNILCLNGFTKIVWFIVIIPILMLTYISSILFYVFGINPGKSTVRVKPQQQQQPQQQPQQQQQQQPPPPRK
jgi:apolipoprotein N-acyltransferase